jgi:hypothetical protein
MANSGITVSWSDALVVSGATRRKYVMNGIGSQNVCRVICRTANGCRLNATVLFDWND